MKNLTTPNDFGPRAVPRARLSRNGLGAVMIYKSNPVSYIVDAVLGCIPFLSLQGGQDKASQAVRAGILGDNEAFSTSGGGGGGGGAATAGTTPPAPTAPPPVAATPAAPATGTANAGGFGTVDPSNPFGYVRAVDQRRF